MSGLRRLLGSLLPLLSRVPPRRAGAVLLCIAALCAVWALVPRAATTPVLVAARDLDTGTAVSPEDLRTAHYPHGLAPADALASAADAADAVLSGSLSAGTPVTRSALLLPASLPGTSEAQEASEASGTLLVPVMLGETHTAAVVRPGHRIHIYTAVDPLLTAPGAGDAQEDAAIPGSDVDGPLVREAVVTAVHSADSGLGAGATVVMVAVDEAEAGRLARAAGAHLSFALVT